MKGIRSQNLILANHEENRLQYLDHWSKMDFVRRLTIDFGEETEINTIETRFYNGNGQWIYAPKAVKLAFDDDDFKYISVFNFENSFTKFNFEIEGKKARVLGFKIQNYGIISEDKQGAGNKAWTFIDEIIIN